MGVFDQLFPPKPTFEEKDVPNLHGKVYIVTGGYSGVGFELTKILYSRNATIYVAGRNPKLGNEAISNLRAEIPDSDGKLVFLKLDLADLPSIKASADQFPEERLHCIVHNAGVMVPPRGSKTKQGWEMQFGTNVLGPFVFQKHLMSKMLRTAAEEPREHVRVLWASSSAQDAAPKNGIDYNNISNSKANEKLSWSGFIDNWVKYSQSKAANNILAVGMAEKYGDSGVISLSFNPGNLKTPLQRHSSWYLKPLIYLIFYPPRFGGLTELYGAVSPSITAEQNGSVIIPWGRIGKLRKDIQKSMEQGGGSKFWEWCEGVTKEY